MGKRAIVLTVVILESVLAVGCTADGLRSPVSPSRVPTQAAVVKSPPPPAPSLASIVLENAFAIGGPMLKCQWNGCEPHPENGYGYDVRFLVREVKGVSGAIIKLITVRNPNYRPFIIAGQSSGQGCWRDDVRVTPGGWVDTFYTDEGAGWLSYCYVGIGTTGETNLLEVEVQFVDDDGNAGSASTTITRFQPLEYPRLM